LAPHAYVDDLEAPALGREDRHHFERVLRLRAGEKLTVSDGVGGWRLCRFGAVLDPAGEVQRDARPAPLLTVAFAIVKGQRPEWAIQKLTEIGIDRIVPLVSARSVVRWPVGPHGDARRGEGGSGDAGSGDDPRGGQLERLRRVAREAAMQSRRTWLPTVSAVASFATVAAEAGAALAHADGGPPSLAHRIILVGPEGGWDDAELRSGLPHVRLGGHVLRTETAALVAGTLMGALRDGTCGPGGVYDSGG